GAATIRPPWASTAWRAIARPRPVPLCLVEKKGSKRRGSASAGTPGPLSVTKRLAPPSPLRTATVTRRGEGDVASASRAFSSRLTSTSRSLSRAARGGDGVADLVRDARRQLADGGELLGVGERALHRDRAREQVRAVEQERELRHEGAEPLHVLLVEEAAEHAGVHEEPPPAAARTQDRRGAERDVGPHERLAQ